IDRYEVSNTQYPGSGTAFSGRNFPREEVSWFDAKAFCEQRLARLPTEAEWEYAARGPSNLIYPWGNKFDPLKVNICDAECPDSGLTNGPDDGYQWTSPVGRYENASWVGAYDLIGNVNEWVSSIYKDYPYDATDGRENPDDHDSDRVVRGSSWVYPGE